MKIKLVMPCQLVALVILISSSNHVNHIILSHLCQKQLVCFDYIQFSPLFNVSKNLTKFNFKKIHIKAIVL
jgi:hypothetical protein